MIIRKYTGKSLLEIEKKCRHELGPEALILNVRQVKPKGLKKLWNRSPYLEAIAAVECITSEEEFQRGFEKPTLNSLSLSKYLESTERIKERLLENAATLLKK